jgi:predicted RNase H-like nuclease
VTHLPASALYGVDWARNFWAVACCSPDLQDVTLRVETDLTDLFAEVIDGGAILVIDIPVGLPDSKPRKCDAEARHLLRFPRSTSVFSPPVRSALKAKSYASACDLNQAASGKRLSRQSYGILPIIRKVDALMTPERQSRIFEAHPEVTFMMLGEYRQGIVANKKSSEGSAERSYLLQKHVPGLMPGNMQDSVRSTHVALDDVHDALACLLTAWRIANCEAITLPEGEPHYDARGLRMEIVA